MTMKSPLSILYTNAFLRAWTGSELYLRDLTMELVRRGHKPAIYSPRTGPLADELRKRSIPVVADLSLVGARPDLIHGQHHLQTMTALAAFPGVPALFFCHGWLPWEEIPPAHPRILRYVTVSDALHDRLVFECGIPEDRVITILNSVDLERFRPRPPLPEIPKRAILLNNLATEANLLGVVREACTRNGITLDSYGVSNLNPIPNPEEQIRTCDILFGVGRTALEGVACGTAVICCGLEGAGEMVTTRNLEQLRRNNFGIRVLERPLTADFLSEQIRRYHPQDAMEASRRVRSSASLVDMADRVLEVYAGVLEEWAGKPPADPAAESRAYSTYLAGLSERFHQNYNDHEIAHRRIGELEYELQLIRKSTSWRLARRIASMGRGWHAIKDALHRRGRAGGSG